MMPNSIYTDSHTIKNDVENICSHTNSEGYSSDTYAKSFSEYGTPLYLANSGGWILSRSIGSTVFKDLIGLYPLFSCNTWSGLSNDLIGLSKDFVTISLVPDPFGNYTECILNDSFDVVSNFKERFITNLLQKPSEFVTKHHRKYAEKGLRQLDIEVCKNPSDHLDEWALLYSKTCRKHNITGISAFSYEAFKIQLTTPGMVMFRAIHNHKTVAMHLWTMRGRYGYGHLAGHSNDAYKLYAPYALYWTALNWFWGKLDFLDLGGAPGVNPDANDGLSFFKRGWSTDTKMSYFCGKVLDRETYEKLSSTTTNNKYFPSYRANKD